MDNVTKFLVYCVEIYKTAFKTSGRQVIQLFNQYGIPEYIIEDITGLIEERRRKEEADSI